MAGTGASSCHHRHGLQDDGEDAFAHHWSGKRSKRVELQPMPAGSSKLTFRKHMEDLKVSNSFSIGQSNAALVPQVP